MTKIDLMIIGAQKAGTTSLKNYLGEHSEVISHSQTEFSYFRNIDEYELGFDHAFRKAYDTNEVNTKVIAKNATLYLDEIGLNRLHAHNPNCIIVFILRDPIDRAYSAYKMGVYQGWEDRKFEEIMEVIDKGDLSDRFYRFYIDPGLYAKQLQMVEAIFPRENIKLILYEELALRTAQICSELFEKLGIDVNEEINFGKRHNQAKTPKYKWLSKLFNAISGKNLLITRVMKKVLGPIGFHRIYQVIYEFNQSPSSSDQPLNPNVFHKLKNYYSPTILELEKHAGINLKDWRSAQTNKISE